MQDTKEKTKANKRNVCFIEVDREFILGEWDLYAFQLPL